jgi:hypothetical protein
MEDKAILESLVRPAKIFSKSVVSRIAFLIEINQLMSQIVFWVITLIIVVLLLFTKRLNRIENIYINIHKDEINDIWIQYLFY